MAASDTSTVVTVLVATGMLTAISETVRWFFQGRGRAKVDTAAIVQGMALDLLRPLHQELDAANASAAQLRTALHDLEMDFESVLGWAVYARGLLDHADVAYKAPPQSLLKRRLG